MKIISFSMLAIACVTTITSYADSSFSGRLAATHCHSNQDVRVSAATVHSGETVVCQSSSSKSVRLVDTTIVAGATFRAVVGGTPTPWGYTQCDPSHGVFSHRDCNRCADDVAGDFNKLFKDASKETKHWSYNENGIYRPSKAKPAEFTNINANSHVQGFVRTNSDTRPFAGTYSRASSSNKGFVFIIKEEDDDLKLTQLHRTWSNHPFGAAVLGSRVWFGDDLSSERANVIRSLPVDGDGATEQGFLAFPPNPFEGNKPKVGGGLALAKLSSGGHLLVATGPGGDEVNPVTDFFYLDGVPLASSFVLKNDGTYDLDIIPLARWKLSDSSSDNKASSFDFGRSENLSLINECGSGDIYVISASSTHDSFGHGHLFGTGRFRLSRIEWRTLPDHNLPIGSAKGIMGPQLDPIAWGELDQNPHFCHPRSAATFWVNDERNLELYCSELEAIAGETKMHFTRRSLD